MGPMTKGEMMKVLLDVQKRYGLPYIKLVIGRRKRNSQASYRHKNGQYMISLCRVWERYGTKAVLADLLHEIIHIYFYSIKQYNENHGPNFRRMERKLLSDYGLIPSNYKRAYYKTLTTDSGQVIYDLK